MIKRIVLYSIFIFIVVYVKIASATHIWHTGGELDTAPASGHIVGNSAQITRITSGCRHGACIQIAANGIATHFSPGGDNIDFADSDDMRFAFAFKPVTTPTGSDAGIATIWRLFDGATSLVWRTTGKLRLANTTSVTLCGSDSTTALNTGTWYWIIFKATRHASSGTISATLWDEGGLTQLDTLSCTGLNTGAAAFQLASIGAIFSATFTAVYDDIVLHSGDDPSYEAVAAQTTISTSACGWTTTGCTLPYECVDEVPNDGDTTRLTASTSGTACTFGLTLAGATTPAIVSPVHGLRSYLWLNPASSAVTLKARWTRVSTTDYTLQQSGSKTPTPNVYNPYKSQMIITDPDTGAAIEPTNLDSVKLGALLSSNVSTKFSELQSEIAIVIPTYTPPGPTSTFTETPTQTPTPTVTPIPSCVDIPASATDGFMYINPGNSNYYTARTTANTVIDSNIVIGAGQKGPSPYIVYRSALEFAGTTQFAGQIITSVTLTMQNLECSALGCVRTQTFNIDIGVASGIIFPLSSNTNANFNACLNATSIGIWGTNQESTSVVHTSGPLLTSSINTAGPTVLCLRSSLDLSSNIPSVAEWTWLYSNEAGAPSYPILRVCGYPNEPVPTLTFTPGSPTMTPTATTLPTATPSPEGTCAA